MKEGDLSLKIIKAFNAIPWVFVLKNHGSIYSYKGRADIEGIFHGRPISIEVKLPRTPYWQKPSWQGQLAYLLKMKELGAIAFVAQSVEEALEHADYCHAGYVDTTNNYKLDEYGKVII